LLLYVKITYCLEGKMVTLRALNSQSISSSSIYLPIQKNSELEHRIAVLRIWYVYPGIPDPNFSIPDPGSKVKNTVFLIRIKPPKKISNLSEI